MIRHAAVSFGVLVSSSLMLAAPVVGAASTVGAPPAREVDALGRSVVDVSGDGRFALTADYLGFAAPDRLVDLRTGTHEALAYTGFPAFLTDDGSMMVFNSFDALLPADTDGEASTYRFDFTTDTLSYVPPTNRPADGWSGFQLKDVSGNGRYVGYYALNPLFADSGIFLLDTQTSTWRQPDSLLPDFALGTQRQSNEVSLSSSGRYAAWKTFFLAGCTSCGEVWVYDFDTNTAFNATKTSAGGDLTDGNARHPRISDDGRHVLFRSNATGIVAGINTVADRVYVRHLDPAQTVLVTGAEASAPYPGPSIGGTGDAVVVMENSPSTLNGAPLDMAQPVLYDLTAGTRAVLTDPVGSAVPNSYSSDVVISGRGNSVLFMSAATNFAAVTPNVPPEDSTNRVFLTERVGPLPARLLDTRSNGRTDDGLFQATGVLAGGVELQLGVGGRRTIPPDAEAVVLNLTATQSLASGFVTAYPCGTTRPLASTLNMVPGRTIANIAVAQLGTNGRVCLYASGTTHLIVDATYVFPAGSELVPVQPQRMLDTRPTGTTIDHLFEKGGLVQGGVPLQLQLAGRGTVPGSAKAVVLNVTSVGSSSSGFAKAYPCGIAPPNASVLNFQSGLTRASLTVVSLSATGSVCLASNVSSHLIADAVGYFDSSSTYVALSPARLLDTRPTGVTVDGLFQAQGIRAAGSTVQLLVSGRGEAPVGNRTVVLNVAATGSAGSGFVTVYSCDQWRPSGSTLNMSLGITVNNHVVVGTGSTGKVCLYVSNSTHLVVDLEGVLP